MSIANKLTYLNQTKALIKQGINNTGGELTENSTFRSYADELNKRVYSGEGTEAKLNTLLEAKMKILGKGNTTQQTYEGYNLLNTNNYEKGGWETGGIPISNNSMYRFNDYISVEGGQTIYLLKSLCVYYDVGEANTSRNLTIVVPSTATKAYFRTFVGDLDTFNPNDYMVSKTPITSYEPYVGGQASPNPSYPQPIKVVTGDNKVIVRTANLFTTGAGETTNAGVVAKYNESEIKLNGTTSGAGNIFYDNTLGRLSNYRKIGTFPAGTYSLTFNKISGEMTIPEGKATAFYIRDTESNNIKGLTISQNTTTITTQFILSEEKTLYSQFFANASDIVFNNYIFNIQIEEGTTATEYVPYKRQELPLNLGSIALCKIGDYQDEFILENGTWYKDKKIGKVILDGTENWQRQLSVTTGKYSFYISHSVKNTNISNNGFCDYFNFINSSESIVNFINAIRFNSSHIFIILDGSDTSVESFKTWLASNNVTVYYVLATPVREEITNTTLISQLNAIYNALSYSDKTYIETESEEENAQLIVSANCLRGEG